MKPSGIRLERDIDFLPIPRIRSGKVRDMFDLGEHLLIVASDRISAFDVVFTEGVPGKGVLLTSIAAHWFKMADAVCKHHLISTEVGDLPAQLKPFGDRLRGRFMLVRKVHIFPIECITRGYLAGSGWRDYQVSGKVCGVSLPIGLEKAQRLPGPIFTPSTKADSGHDLNITQEHAREIVGTETFETLERLSLKLYRMGRDYLDPRGIIMADTKFEFGQDEHGEILLADEILTPDSSRFWPKNQYAVGISPPSLDKQYLRDYLETLDWDKTPPAPTLPEDVIDDLFEKYFEIYKIITGHHLYPGTL